MKNNQSTKLRIILIFIMFLVMPVWLLIESNPVADIVEGNLFSRPVLAFLALTGNAILIIIFFSYHLLKNKAINSDQKMLWLVGFLLLGFIFIPLYIWILPTPGSNEEAYGRHPGTFKEDLIYRVRTIGQSLRKNLTMIIAIALPAILILTFFVFTAEPTPKPTDIIDHFQESGLIVGQSQELERGELTYLPRQPDRNIQFLLPPSDLEGIGLIFYYEDDLDLETAVQRLQETAEHPTEGQVSAVYVENNLILFLSITADPDTLALYHRAFQTANNQ